MWLKNNVIYIYLSRRLQFDLIEADAHALHNNNLKEEQNSREPNK